MSTETKKALVVAGFCLGPDRGDVFPGDEIELDAYTYRLELDRGRIRAVAETPEDNSAVTAAALAQAHRELIEKITQAPDVSALEGLLSEDPEIIAAYEARMLELEGDHHEP